MITIEHSVYSTDVHQYVVSGVIYAKSYAFLQDKVYLDNLEASVCILKKLSEERIEQHLNQSSLEVVKQTLKGFQQKVAFSILIPLFFYSYICT